MKTDKLLLLAATMAAATAARSAAFAFRSLDFPRRPPPSRASSNVDSSSSSHSSSPTALLLARGEPPSGGFGGGKTGKGPKKYSIDDRSYGGAEKGGGGGGIIGEGGRASEDASDMAEFFAAHGEWGPLFRGILLGGGDGGDASRGTAMARHILLPDRASSALPPDLWGIPTLERRNPWRLLPSKPTSDASLRALSSFLDEWQRSLLDIPLDALVTGVNDLHFLEEGRRTIAVTRFHVLDEYHRDADDDEFDREGVSNDARAAAPDDDDDDGRGRRRHHYDWEAELFRTCWSELAHLTYQDDADTGSLVLLPDRDDVVVDANGNGSGRLCLEVARDFVERNLIRPMRWLGRDDDWEIVAMERGGVAVRLLYKLSEIPDLER